MAATPALVGPRPMRRSVDTRVGAGAAGHDHRRMPADLHHLATLARWLRRHCLQSCAAAGSGHVTSAFSATELMTGLVFGGTFAFDIEHPEHPNNDRLLFSKGHASPLFYGLWAAAGALAPGELETFRKLGSTLEGHPTRRFRFAEAATGSLGQGLGIGFGMALNAARLDRLPHRTYVLLGDSELAEGSQWETAQLAAHYRLGNLTAVLDANRLGQRGPTMVGHDLTTYARRFEAFGWRVLVIDGHAFPEILDAFASTAAEQDRPVAIIARTVKGKGVSFLEDAEGWHGRPVPRDRLDEALAELGPVDEGVRGQLPRPADRRPGAVATLPADPPPEYARGEKVATRKAFGAALARLHAQFPRIVSLDAEVGNSTRADLFAAVAPDRFFEMYIAEQNMVEAAVGLALRGKTPFVSTFAAFLTRASDQIRMARYSDAAIKFVGSHAGVSIGEDGPSQMGLEDIALFRAVPDTVVLHPCDAVSTDRLVAVAAEHPSMVYLRTLRQATPVIYGPEEEFAVGGSKLLRGSTRDGATIVAAGSTVTEALAAHEILRTGGIQTRVIDAYSIAPLDAATLRRAAEETGAIVTVEDHYPAGGLGEAVLAVLADAPVPVTLLAVRERPTSGSGAELREQAGISAMAIVRAVKQLVGRLAARRAEPEDAALAAAGGRAEIS